MVAIIFKMNKKITNVVYSKAILSTALCLGVIYTLSGCKDYGRINLASIHADANVRPYEANYRTKAVAFVRYAQEGNIEKMIAMTSKKTLSLQGQEVRASYSQRVIPALRGSRVSWDEGSKLVLDSDYNPGFEFSGTAYGNERFPLYIVLFEENGEIVIANIRRTEKVN